MSESRVLIAGAAGRDFHCFNLVYREDPSTRVVAFTAAQIPGIAGRRYPPDLAGPRYPEGLPIHDEIRLEEICKEEEVDEVVLAYSDLAHADAMHIASRALASGADFRILGPDRTMLQSKRPVVAVSAVRTGCGKSQTARWLARRAADVGLRVMALRHPMPYGVLAVQRVQRFATREDLDAARCTAEEREEYEPWIESGAVVFAGVDYAAILQAAEAEADLIVWDGGNNDFPFVKPDLHLVIVDALRPDQVATHHPGETVARMADVAIVNKVNAASAESARRAIEAVRRVNPRARILRSASPVRLDDPSAVAGRRVLVVEDGPTITHGGMAYGAGYVAATEAGAAEFVDPRLSARPEIAAVFDRYPHIGAVLPAMGYGESQLAALQDTINSSEAEVVVAGTPIDLAHLVPIEKPVVRARYGFEEIDEPGLGDLFDEFLRTRV